MSDAALDLMWGLVLEDGRRWGEVAVDHQKADAEAILTGDVRRHFATRPRGGSKTTDLAAVTLAHLAVDAPLRSRGYVVASNGEQAGILIDAAASLVARTPEIDGVLKVENEKIEAPNGAWVRILNLSDSGAWGLRDAHLLILDEFAQWPETRAAKRVYTAVRTTVQKTKGCRLVILTSAGEPSHWGHEVYEQALGDPSWRVSEMPGPVAWQDPAEIEALRRELRPSEFDRLVLNIWSEDEDRAVSPEDYATAAREPVATNRAPQGLTGGGWRLHHPRPDRKYVITVDIGTRKDATVMCVAHAEPADPDDPKGPHRCVVDHLERWQGSRKRPVQLRDVETWLVTTASLFNRAEIHADPDQFVGTLQNLNRAGVKANEFVFSTSSVGQVATALVQAFRNQQVEIPDSAALKEELLRVRLRESSPGVTRLDHDRSGHDDQAVTIGMACHLLLSKSWGTGAAFQAMMRKQIGERQQSDTARRDAEQLNRLIRSRRGQPDRARERRQKACQHRWRSETCVLCGAAREAS